MICFEILFTCLPFLCVIRFSISAWVSLIPEGQQWDNAVACIGETTAVVAKKMGMENVFFPANPGIEG